MHAGGSIRTSLPCTCTILDHGSNTGTCATTNPLVSRVTTTRSSNAAIAAMNRSGCPKVWRRFCPSTTIVFPRTMTSSVIARTRPKKSGRRVRLSQLADRDDPDLGLRMRDLAGSNRGGLGRLGIVQAKSGFHRPAAWTPEAVINQARKLLNTSNNKKSARAHCDRAFHHAQGSSCGRDRGQIAGTEIAERSGYNAGPFLLKLLNGWT